MTRLTSPNRRLEAAPRRERQGSSHLMGPLSLSIKGSWGRDVLQGGSPRPGWVIAAPQLSFSFPNVPCLATGRSWRLPSHSPPSSPLQKIRRALAVSRGAVRGINSFFWAEWACAKCSGKEGVWELLPLLKDTPKGGVLATLWAPALTPSCPAGLENFPWREAETAAGGFRAQRAVKWWTLGPFNRGGMPNCLPHS